MNNLLTRLGLWIAQWGHWPSAELIDGARALCRAQEQADVSGEYKRHQVFARMLKTYPTISRRTIGLAIELALLR